MKSSTINFEFGKLVFEDNITVGLMNEGILIDKGKFSCISNALTNHFGNQSYGYVSHRINSYSVDPTVYAIASKKENLKTIAVVSTASIIKSNVTIERQFI